MIRAFSRAFQQLSDPGLKRYVWISVTATLAVFLLSWGGAVWALALFDIPNYAFTLFGWEFVIPLDALATIAGAVVVLVLLGFMFPSILILIVGVFLEDVAQVIEDRHYPALGKGRNQSLVASAAIALKFAGLSLVLNLLALILFLLLFWIAPLNFFVFYAVNGYLLGWEYYELVAYRRLSPSGALRLSRAYRGQLFVAGVLIAMMMSVPLLNLVVPIVATAAMVHLVQDWRARYPVSD